MISLDFLLSIVNSIAIFALITMTFGLIIRTFKPGMVKSSILGVMFGTGASLAIANTSELAPGLFVDPRSVMLVLAGPFGGPICAAVAALLTSAVRLWVGGIGATAGVCNIVASAMIGVLFSRFVFRSSRPESIDDYLLLGLASSVPFLFILTVPIDNALAVLSEAIVPLTIAGTIGIMILGPFLQRERRAVLRERTLTEEASTDPLTRLSNRRQFNREIAGMIEMSRSRSVPVTTLVIDIDLFKRFNDTFGHDVGDRILVEVAAIIRAQVRSTDAVARFGGEEIVVVMPGTREKDASIVAERIRATIDEKVHHGDLEAGNVTVSIGLASGAGDGLSFETLFKRADEAMYRAKKNGRNRVETQAEEAFERGLA